MFKEIKNLKDNLETESRGDAVGNVKTKIQELLQEEDWKNAQTFLIEYEIAFEGKDTVLNIIKNKFQDFVDKLIAKDPEFDNITMLNNLESMQWFDSIDDSIFKKGYIAEHMADFGQDIVEIAKLQEARGYYRRAHRNEDTARVQNRLSEKVKSFNWAPVVSVPAENPALARQREKIAKALQTWKAESNKNKKILLAVDFAGIRPRQYQEEQEEGGDIYLTGFLEKAGVIQTVGLSTEDGRVDSGGMAPSQERIYFDSCEVIIMSFLSAFAEPVKEWLLSQDGDVKVCQNVGGNLKVSLDWDDNSTEYFMEGIAAWVSGCPQAAMSFWLPFFESALRYRLGKLGEDIINPQPRPGIEDFIIFDNLLKKATNHYEERTVEYWRMIFSKHNGLGWNLRNAFCHGILPLSAMKVNTYSLAVFLAYLFLLYTKEKSEEE